jgi:hypothetical protein
LKPALLYIVPLCLIIPLFIALIKGDIKEMFAYRDHDDSSTEEEDGQNVTSSSTTSLNTSKLTDKDTSLIEPKKTK